MSYHVLPNIALILALLGIVAMILRRLPEAVDAKQQETQEETVHDKLSKKGLPVMAFSRAKSWGRFWGQKIWHFVLEAKDLKPASATGYKIRKMFNYGATQKTPAQSAALPGTQTPAATPPASLPKETPRPTEQEILDAIKKEPKNHRHYDDLGKLYLDQKNFSDAKDIYLYLVNHESGHSEYHAKLAYSCYQLREFSTAVEHYKKATALDSTHPNRYYNLALCLSVLGRQAEAVENFGKAAAMEPDNFKYRQALEKAKATQAKPAA